MYWRDAVATSLASASLLAAVHGQVVTVTEYASMCSAVYRTVHPTATVQPVPWTDADANSGLPFVLQITGSSYSRTKRQTPGATWLMANGNTTADSTMAQQYRISNSQLQGVNGGYMSTLPYTENEPFALASMPAAISTTFSVQGGVLYWNNSDFNNFQGGSAEFYKNPSTTLVNAQIIAWFSGSYGAEWERVALMAMPCKWPPAL
ncbi:hypothetical protein BAUCODRAFT_372041 [Baudoinia panamericana UAMH 10762]|uniref:DUF7908 domain-containing protein n=1 Tax=Baudoinia panamericana (strain UAMH 10762) TaxID=717646 RepID=M2NM67_BAUPA|nr:uncharacterized protein BAUCODRAFT_372041 [Baudoinia panamericana UAMH 10762]EMD00271.1 hypothetical protein BAUCODRAFT_372041 [Baudoinia panamericana UAMH 10762]